jgi:sulfotransferase family protein
MRSEEFPQTEQIKPILVCGAPRSGTTWVGRMLALSPALYYVHEPFNPDVPAAKFICQARFKYRNIYITEENERRYYRPIKRMLTGKFSLLHGLARTHSYREMRQVIRLWREFGRYRRQGIVPLIKDPIALMSAGWLARRFDINVIVMIRHPAAFVNSMKNRNWSFFPSRWALPQSLLMRDYLNPFEKQMIELEHEEHDIIDKTALLWKILHYVILQYKKRHKDWVFARHEDFAMNSIDSFCSLYKSMGLLFSDDIRQRIHNFSKETNPMEEVHRKDSVRRNSRATVSNWKKTLTPSEVKRIRIQVEEISRNFYLDNDWN